MNAPKLVAQQTSQDIISHFKDFMDDQERLSKEVEKIAPSLAEEKLIEIVRICSAQNENKKSGYNRLCGTLLLWKKKKEPSFSVKKFAEQNLGNKGTQINEYKKIVKGYSSWISPKDWSKIYENESLDSLTIKTLPQLEISEEAKQEIQFIDIIWFNKNNQVIQAFYIENDEKLISSRLLHIADFIFLEKITFNLVVPKLIEKKANTELSRRTFQSLGIEHHCQLTVIEDW